MACGRVRKKIDDGWNNILEDELKGLRMAILKMPKGFKHTVCTEQMEYGFVLINGWCAFEIDGKMKGEIGPRKDPFTSQPYGLMVTKEEKVLISAKEDSLIGVGMAPANKKMSNKLITPDMTGGGVRGKDNWSRLVRFVLWSDNSEGNCLMMGETVAPSGNWCTIPPHRHQYLIENEEVPYEEAYFFQFSKPQGFALGWQFDDNQVMDIAFSIKSNDTLYMDKGYHPVACAPGSSLYQLTVMSGPFRISKAKIHEDYQFILNESNMENPYHKQNVENK